MYADLYTTTPMNGLPRSFILAEIFVPSLLSLLLFVTVLLFSVQGLFCIVCCYCVIVALFSCIHHNFFVGLFVYCVVSFPCGRRPKTDFTNMTARTENLTDFNRYDIINKVFSLNRSNENC